MDGELLWQAKNDENVVQEMYEEGLRLLEEFLDKQRRFKEYLEMEGQSDF